jgi:hypothetical protein
MLRVRTAISGFEGGPGLQTSYFVGLPEDAACALRCTDYVHSLIDAVLLGVTPDSVWFTTSGDVDVIDPADGSITNTWSVAAPAAQQGVGGESKAPPAVAGLIRLGTNSFIAGRRVRGRMFISPLAAGAISTDGTLTAGALVILNAVGPAVLDNLTDGDTWVVWHRPKVGAPGSTAIIHTASAPAKLAVLTSRRD